MNQPFNPAIMDFILDFNVSLASTKGNLTVDSHKPKAFNIAFMPAGLFSANAAEVRSISLK